MVNREQLIFLRYILSLMSVFSKFPMAWGTYKALRATEGFFN
jgi:hypothetical protein